mmetsp:Transcript_11629/g.32791  ORF Transcript_11629/g.32791 Transcript_11629/m.32791 type:complete len:232 (+) Transcript_11629:404-1099(+)
MLEGGVPMTVPMYASGGRDSRWSPNCKCRYGSPETPNCASQAAFAACKAAVILRAAARGITRREVPLSTMAPQPWSQAMALTLEDLRPSESPRWTPVSLTPHVCSPLTGVFMNKLEFCRGMSSCQMKYPSDPTALPKQTEKLSTCRASNKESFRVELYNAASTLSLTNLLSLSTLDLLMGAGHSAVRFFQVSKRFCSSFTISQADDSGLPGGPTPTMAWNSECSNTGMSAS